MCYDFHMEKISVVICAYNEESRIANVLHALQGHPLVAEVIVVNDGSTDQTEAVVHTFPDVTCLTLDKNRGKSYALAQGVKKACKSRLMLLDADLIGITGDNITALAAPVLEGKADVALSVRANSLWIYRFMNLDFVSGERVLPRSILLSHLKEIETLPSYGIEVFMNKKIIADSLRVATVAWDNVRITNKSEKIGAWRGFLGEMRMARQILSVLSWHQLISQQYQMLRLRQS